MANRRIVVTEADFNTEMEALMGFIKVVTGAESGRPRFQGFKITDKPKGMIEEAVQVFAEGNFSEALEHLREARRTIEGMERFYARNAVEVFFFPRVSKLPELDQDIRQAIDKKFRNYQEVVKNLGRNGDMGEVSRVYWVLMEAIQDAPREQAAREVNRRERESRAADETKRAKIAAKKVAEEERAKASRTAQREADERQRLERESRAKDWQSQLASLGQ
jgi:hypothetical protein